MTQLPRTDKTSSTETPSCDIAMPDSISDSFPSDPLLDISQQLHQLDQLLDAELHTMTIQLDKILGGGHDNNDDDPVLDGLFLSSSSGELADSSVESSTITPSASGEKHDSETPGMIMAAEHVVELGTKATEMTASTAALDSATLETLSIGEVFIGLLFDRGRLLFDHGRLCLLLQLQQ